jgi:hypothetical protein
LLLAGVVTALTAAVVAGMLHELRPLIAPRPSTVSSTRPQLATFTAEEEGYAAALWDIHRAVTPSAVAMSVAGIAYQTENHDVHELEHRIEPLKDFFRQADARVRALAAPRSLAKVKAQYADATALYANAAEEMLKFVRDGEQQHLVAAHDMDINASENILRAGEVLWPGQYKPH